MSMGRTNFKVVCEALDADGNGQVMTFEQRGCNYEMLLELQAKVARPTVAAVTAVAGGWLDAAIKEAAGKG